MHQNILEYMLETLSEARVQETLILCTSSDAAIHSYLTCAQCSFVSLFQLGSYDHLASSSRWNRPMSPMRIVLVVARNVITVGDALRELDSKALIVNDFILMVGCVVTTVRLDAVVQEHKERRTRDRESILTTVFRKVQPGHRIRYDRGVSRV